MLKVINESNSDIIMPFDINNPGRHVAEFFGKSSGGISNHDYQKFEKGKDSKIVYMTADEYIDECINNIFHSNYESAVTHVVNTENVKKYASDMKNGDIFPIPYLNYIIHQQEGRHRMLAFKLLNGANAKAPVLTIFKTETSEEEIEDYCTRKWGELGQHFVSSIKKTLGLSKDEEELEPDDSDIYEISDESEDDFDKTVEILAKKTGKSKEEIMNLDPLSLSRLMAKYW